MSQNPYAELGVPSTATMDEIEQARKAEAQRRHPDHSERSASAQAQATRATQELDDAYKMLSDPVKRAIYDRYGAEVGRSAPV
jgi:DnaJ-class molecular chaperone